MHFFQLTTTMISILEAPFEGQIKFAVLLALLLCLLSCVKFIVHRFTLYYINISWILN